MCTVNATPRVETAAAKAFNKSLFNICDRQLCFYLQLICMSMETNPRRTFVLKRLPTLKCLKRVDIALSSNWWSGGWSVSTQASSSLHLTAETLRPGPLEPRKTHPKILRWTLHLSQRGHYWRSVYFLLQDNFLKKHLPWEEESPAAITCLEIWLV